MLQLVIYILIGVVAFALLIYLFNHIGKKEAEASPQYRWQKAVEEYGDPAMINLYQNAKSNEEREEIATFVSEALGKRQSLAQAASQAEQDAAETEEVDYTRELPPKASPQPAEDTMTIDNILAAPAYQFWQDPEVNDNRTAAAAKKTEAGPEQPATNRAKQLPALCPVCGEPMEDGYDFCIYCGNKIIIPAEPEPEPEPIAPLPATAPAPIAPAKKAPRLRNRRKERAISEAAAAAAQEEQTASTDTGNAFCTFCGEPLEPGNTFCIYCGKSAAELEEPQTRASQSAAMNKETPAYEAEDSETPAMVEPVYPPHSYAQSNPTDTLEQEQPVENDEPQASFHEPIPEAAAPYPAPYAAVDQEAEPDFIEPEPLRTIEENPYTETNFVESTPALPVEPLPYQETPFTEPPAAVPDSDATAPVMSAPQTTEASAAHDFSQPRPAAIQEEPNDAFPEAEPNQAGDAMEDGADEEDNPQAMSDTNPFAQPTGVSKEEAAVKQPMSLQEILENMRALEEKIFAEVAAAEQETQNVPLAPRVKPVKKN